MNREKRGTEAKKSVEAEPLTALLPLLRYKLSPEEQKILYAFMVKLNDAEGDMPGVSLRLSELIASGHFPEKSGRNILIRAAKNLCRRVFTGQSPEGHIIITGWINYAKFYVGDDKEEYLLFDFNPNIKPLLRELQKTYFQTPAGVILSFKRIYSPKIYQFLQQLPTGQPFKFTLQDLTREFNLPDSFRTNITHFRKKFWEPAIEEINKNSRLSIVYDYITEGRSIRGINVAKAIKKGAQLPTVALAEEIKERWTIKDKALLVRLTNQDRWKLSREKAEELLWQYGPSRVKRNLDYAATHEEDPDNPVEWLIQCIEGDYSASDDSRRQRKKALPAASPGHCNDTATGKKFAIPIASTKGKETSEERAKVEETKKTRLDVVDKKDETDENLTTLPQPRTANPPPAAKLDKTSKETLRETREKPSAKVPPNEANTKGNTDTNWRDDLNKLKARWQNAKKRPGGFKR